MLSWNNHLSLMPVWLRHKKSMMNSSALASMRRMKEDTTLTVSTKYLTQLMVMCLLIMKATCFLLIPSSSSLILADLISTIVFRPGQAKTHQIPVNKVKGILLVFSRGRVFFNKAGLFENKRGLLFNKRSLLRGRIGW